MKKTLYLILFFLLVPSLWARWATLSELSYSVNKSIAYIDVKADGAYTETLEQEFELLQESGKEEFKIYRIHYNGDTTKVKIESAKIINGTKEKDIDLTRISDTFVANQAQGFDASKEMAFAIPNLKVGSIIKLKYTYDHFKPRLKGHFSYNMNFGNRVYEKMSETHIVSDIELKWAAMDPENVVEVKTSKKDGRFHLIQKLKKPILRIRQNEMGGVFPQEFLTMVSVSSIKSWADLSRQLSENYEKKVLDKLPSKLEDIYKKASAKKTLEGKVDTVLSEISKGFNYVGDWRTVEGSYYPRNVGKIVEDEFGDCKDFSLLTVSILRKLGIDASFALVKRGVPYEPKLIHEDIIQMEYFNHAIVHVREGDKEYWIDPTNNISYGLKHRMDISQKDSLVLKNETTSLKHIPPVEADRNSQTIFRKYDFKSDEKAEVKGTYYLTGDLSLAFSGLDRKLDPARVELVFQNVVTEGDKTPKINLKKNDLNSYSYKDLNLEFDYTAQYNFSEKEGSIFVLPQERIALILANAKQDDISHLYIGPKRKIERNIEINNIKVLSELPRGCEESNQWLDASRRITKTKNGFGVIDKIVIKEDLINSNIFKSNDFELLRSKMYNCFARSFIKFAHVDSKIEGLNSKIEKISKMKRDERIEVAKKALFARGHKVDHNWGLIDAMRAMEYNLKEDPKDVDSILLLARSTLSSGYISGRDYEKDKIEKALNLVNYAIEIQPKNHISYVRKANLYRVLEKYKEAEELINKALDLAGGHDSKAYLLLGRIYYQVKAYDRAEKLYELASENARTDEEKIDVHCGYAADMYTSQGQYEKSIEAYKNCLRYDPNNAWDHHNLSLVYSYQKRWDEAIVYSRAAIKLMDFGLANKMLVEFTNAKAEELLKDKKFDEAINMVEESLQVYRDWKTYFLLSKIYFYKKNYEEAIKALKFAYMFEDADKLLVLKKEANIYRLKIEEHRMKEDYEKLDKLYDDVLALAQTPLEKVYYGTEVVSNYPHGGKNRVESIKYFSKIVEASLEDMSKDQLERGDVALAVSKFYLSIYRTQKELSLLDKCDDFLEVALKSEKYSEEASFIKKQIDFFRDANFKKKMKNNKRLPASIEKMEKDNNFNPETEETSIIELISLEDLSPTAKGGVFLGVLFVTYSVSQRKNKKKSRKLKKKKVKKKSKDNEARAVENSQIDSTRTSFSRRAGTKTLSIADLQARERARSNKKAS